MNARLIPLVIVCSFMTPGRLEPWVSIRRVIDDQVDDDADAALFGLIHELHEVAERAQAWAHPVKILDVIAVVAIGRGIKRQKPDAGYADAREEIGRAHV